jgi:hypothetical protein
MVLLLGIKFVTPQHHVNLIKSELMDTNTEWRKAWSIGPPKEYLEALGQIAVNSALVESLLKATIWHYAGVAPEMGRAFTGQVRHSELTAMLINVVAIKSPSDALRAEIKDLRDKITESFQLRGVYLHRTWGMGNNGPMTSTFLALKSSDKESNVDVTLEELRSLAETFHALISRLQSHILSAEMRSQMPPEIVAAFLPAPWLDK